MATRSLRKRHSNLISQFLRKPLHLTTPVAQSTIIDEDLRLPPTRKPQHPPPSPALLLSDFLGTNQKLLVGEEGFLSARQCLQTKGSAAGGCLSARGRGGSSSSRKRIDNEEEFDDDEFDDDDGDFPEGLDDKDFDGEFSEDFDEDEDDEIDNKPRRKK